MTDVEERVIAFVVEETRTERDRIGPAWSLQESGVDGDDATESFLKFADGFRVDLTRLQPHWHRHFRSEVCLPVPKGCLVVIGAALVTGFGIHLVFDPIPVWAATIGLIALLGWACRKVFNYYVSKGKEPITIRDLVDAANCGQWVKQYEQGET